MAGNEQVFQIDELVIHGGAENIRYPNEYNPIHTGNILPMYYGYSSKFTAFGMGQDDAALFDVIWGNRVDRTVPNNPNAHANGCPMVCAKFLLKSFNISRGSKLTLKIDYFKLLPFPGPGILNNYGVPNTELWTAIWPNPTSHMDAQRRYFTSYNWTSGGFGYPGIAAMGGYAGAGAVVEAKLYVIPNEPSFKITTDQEDKQYSSDRVTLLSNFPLTDQWYSEDTYATRNITMTASGMTLNSRVIFAMFVIAGCNCKAGKDGVWPVYAAEITSYFPKEGYVWRKFGSKNTSSSSYDPEGVRIDPDKCDNKWHLVRPLYFMNQKGHSTKWTNVEGEE